jgi:hypothetical protein
MRIRVMALLLALAMLAVGACTAGSTPTPAPTPTPTPTLSPVCESLAAIEASVAGLTQLSPLEAGVEGYLEALRGITDSIRDLRTSAGGQLSAQIDALEKATDDLQAALDNLGSGGIAGSLVEIGTAVTAVGTTLGELRQEARSAFAECG